MRKSAALLILPVMVASLSAQAPAAPAGAPQSQTSGATLPSGPELAAALTRLMANDARVRDWAQLARYREQNRALAKPASGESRVVFMGDSITDAWPQERFGNFFASNKSYIGRGISAQTTPQMLVRFRPDVINLQPKAVVILAGTNDIAGNTGPMSNEDIQNNLMSMAELAKANKIKVVLSSITPISGYHVSPNGVPQTQQRPMERIRAINDWMKKYAAAEGHIYLDYFSAMIDQSGMLREELSGDDLHPNAKGYAIMAPLADAAIKQALR
jgi:lysophospholipase L1-like esterase